MDLIESGENQRTQSLCQPSETDQTFTPDNIRRCEKYVRTIQRRLDKAVANDDRPKIRWYSHLLLKKSRACKVLAVHRICNVNQGGHTAGIDGVSMPHDKGERLITINEILNHIDVNRKPSPIRRTYIPKPNGKQRPLGIPTITDRINQEIVRQAIEPIVEYHFLSCSYGFRPKKSCQDAVEGLFAKLSRKPSDRWIIEGDIKGCFDHISHDHIISTLMKWQTPHRICYIIRRMLKASLVWNGENTLPLEGTPQGGVISPMLVNVALTCLDEEVKAKYGRRYRDRNRTVGINIPLVRYADDFVITAKTKEEAESIKSHIGSFLYQNIGVELSDEKTHITEIGEGFDFLGFNFRKYKRVGIEKLIIKPSKENVLQMLQKIRLTFRNLKDAPVEALLRTLNPIINGWGNYYRHISAKRTFAHISAEIWKMTWRWVQRKHPTLPKKRARAMYYAKKGKNNWLFQSERGTELAQMKKIPIRRFIKARNDKRVYNVNDRQYWESREYVNAKNSIHGSVLLKRLFNEQRGRCGRCGEPITDEQVKATTIHIHHMKPRSEGGDWKSGNLRLLHSECHNSLHALCSRKQMAGFIDKGIDYLRLLKPAKPSSS